MITKLKGVHIPNAILKLMSLGMLSPAEAILYAILYETRGEVIRNHELAKVFRCRGLTITRMLNRLVKLGLVHREGLGTARRMRAIEVHHATVYHEVIAQEKLKDSEIQM